MRGSTKQGGERVFEILTFVFVMFVVTLLVASAEHNR